MRRQEKSVYAEARAFHEKIVMALIDTRSALVKMTTSGDTADVVYALKETLKFVEGVKKIINEDLQLAEKLTCAMWMRDASGDPIRTDSCVASPKVKQAPKLPKKGTEEYSALLAHYGVPESAPFQPHWPDMRDQVSADLAQGKPMPPGCKSDEVWTIFSVTCHKKRGVLGDDSSPADLVSDPDLVTKRLRLLNAILTSDFGPLVNLFTAMSEVKSVNAEQVKLDVAERLASQTPEFVEPGAVPATTVNDEEDAF